MRAQGQCIRIQNQYPAGVFGASFDSFQKEKRKEKKHLEVRFVDVAKCGGKTEVMGKAFLKTCLFFGERISSP